MTSHHENIDIAAFQEDLLQWYEENKRELPWRENQDPYRVWVSEIMLQQTKVETVIPYFKRFLENFPTVSSLAEAEEEQVLKTWEGLGYYSRARNLHSAVKEIKEVYGGEVPSSKEDFSSLKGVGPYTAGAVMSIAFDKPEPAVDGNVMRVFSRILLIRDDIGKSKTRKKFEQILPSFLEGIRPSQFNQALMELGALVCTPKSPGCLLCPVQDYCLARAEGVQTELPVKAKKKSPSTKEMAAVIVKNKEGKTLFHQRGETGLLARLWEYPNIEVEKGKEQEQVEKYLREQFGITATISKTVQYVQHVFSHLIWNITVYDAHFHDKEAVDLKAGEWLHVEEAEKLTFPVSHQKILRNQKEREDEIGS
ncbi:A/G-specific adenine glycosylase [Alteribacillus iranensis]|uniref:Adenine DNA glycosylase n=1 Tax=Alteribacillus iranensis TaxID=930128 RepID=A0A1I2F9P4_9BACI|nr:A/G-specific adenine glycosylase [Alteribacillus iranensis]SFF01915.1 A/G-specific DNA-adenine glycosylase [Alteribacillus iranensis]